MKNRSNGLLIWNETHRKTFTLIYTNIYNSLNCVDPKGPDVVLKPYASRHSFGTLFVYSWWYFAYFLKLVIVSKVEVPSDGGRDFGWSSCMETLPSRYFKKLCKKFHRRVYQSLTQPWNFLSAIYSPNLIHFQPCHLKVKTLIVVYGFLW